ncbi:MAG: hypothetical protein K6G65_01580 [Lachnospiraceae bacterium]|nr:hypothetical protein [Lachnospiraceae bacterium]
MPKRSERAEKGTKSKLGTYRAPEGSCLNGANQPKKSQKASWELAWLEGEETNAGRLSLPVN